MKSVVIFWFFLFAGHVVAQTANTYELTDVQNNKTFTVRDSLGAVKFLDSLVQNNYYFAQIRQVKKEQNHTRIFFDKGKNFNEARVSLTAEISGANRLPETLYTKNLDSLKKKILEGYREKGYPFGRIKTEYVGMEKQIPRVRLSFLTGAQRKIDQIVIKGYEKLPPRFISNLNRDFLGKTYRDQTLSAINTALQNHPFLILEKPPQTLFTRDSTQIFLFLQKKKSNSFDGVLGFGNDKSEKFSINGSINVNFRNMFNRFETVNLFWQRNADRGQTFDLQTDIPYLFSSNVGFNANVNIFRQDSTYATVKLSPSIYLHLNSKQKLGLRGRLETSTVADSLFTAAKDFTRKGVGLWYRYTEPSDVELFLHKTRIQAETDFLSTKYTQSGTTFPQTGFLLSGEYNLNISGNNYLNFKGEAALLHSRETLAGNELLRTGGWNSFRGFNENSLLADFYYYGGVEYRYVVGTQAFFDVFAQYGQINNKVLNVTPKLYSFGFGFNFFLPIGLMSFQIANGNEFGNPMKFNDTKIHWGILSRF